MGTIMCAGCSSIVDPSLEIVLTLDREEKAIRKIVFHVNHFKVKCSLFPRIIATNLRTGFILKVVLYFGRGGLRRKAALQACFTRGCSPAGRRPKP